MGKAQIRAVETAQILTRATGFISGFDYTLNPYVGCQFGCAYCYAAFFVSEKRRDDWGYWVDVKRNAVELLTKRRVLKDKNIYMSSVTDPYQPVELRIGLTRSILEAVLPESRQPRLVIQTRSPFVTRDIDLFKRFRKLRVNMTVTTDCDVIRKRFEPMCPSNDRRLEALEQVKAAGIRTGICITPMLPLENPELFALRLAASGADVYVAQPFKPSRGAFAASTRSMATDIAREFNWTVGAYRQAFSVLRRHLPHLYEGRDGFMPE